MRRNLGEGPAVRLGEGERSEGIDAVDALDASPGRRLHGGVRPACGADRAAVGRATASAAPGGSPCRSPSSAGSPWRSDRPHHGAQPERGEVAHRAAPADALLPLPLRSLLPPARASGARPRPSLVTAGIIAFTFSLEYLPLPGFPPPPHYLAYRIAFAVAFGFLFSYVVIQLFLAGRGEPPDRRHRGCACSPSPSPASRSRWSWRRSGFAATRHPGQPGPDRGHGDPVPDGPGVALLRPGLPDPQGRRRLPPGHRRPGLGRRLARRGRAPPPPRVRTGRSLQGRAPRRDGTVRGPLPVLGRRIRLPDDWSERRRRRGATDPGAHATAAPPIARRARSAPTCRTSAARSCASSTSWPAWSGWPSSAAKWPSRLRSRPRTTA